MQEQMEPEQVKRAAAGQKKAQLEQRFLEAWRRLFPSLPKPTMQHRFHDRRQWRFDFCWLDFMIAVEIQGGSFGYGAHNRPVQQQKDYEKQRAAIKLGWRVIPFNSLDMKDADYCAEYVAELMTNAVEVTPTRRAAV